jgi:4,5-DOPA dioxygenase extradiol
MAGFKDSGVLMPVFFIGHGSPMNAIEDNEFSRAWIEAAKSIPVPTAILCISAHWETSGTQVTSAERPATIHDFGGFPEKLYQVQYPAPGSPELAALVIETVKCVKVTESSEWGLDHGAWSVLCRMFPKADIPVVQLSLARYTDPEVHFAIAKELRQMRNQGVLIVGSGNIVHNLGMVQWQDVAYDWARAFDAKIAELIRDRKFDRVVRYEKLGREAQLAIPTNEHYLPLLYALAESDDHDQITFFAEKVTMGSMSMRSVRIG